MQQEKNEIKSLLREAGVDEAELNIATEKIFDFANALFDKWLTQKKQTYGERKV